MSSTFRSAKTGFFTFFLYETVKNKFGADVVSSAASEED